MERGRDGAGRCETWCVMPVRHCHVVWQADGSSMVAGRKAKILNPPQRPFGQQRKPG